MNIIKENIDELNSVIKLTLEKSDYEPRVAAALKSHQKKMNMPGFRPGKVPEGLVKKMYGKAILVDEINKQASESLFDYISENKLDILGEPLPSLSQAVVDLDVQETIEFAFDIALKPVVKIDLDKKIKIPRYSVKVTDEMVSGQVKAMVGRLSTSQKVEVVNENSLVKGSITQLGDDGTDLADGITSDKAIMSMAVFKDESQKAKFIGKQVGDEIVFNPRLSFPNDTELSYLLSTSKEIAAGVSGEFRFAIDDITEFVEPEFTQEIFDKLFEPGSVTSKDEMEAKVRENLQVASELESDMRFAVDARQVISDKFNVNLPGEFLKRWMKASNKESFSDDDLEKGMPAFLEDLKWQLIKNEIARTNEIKVENADLLEYAKKSVKLQFMRYGIMSIADEHLDSYATSMLNDKEQVERMANGASNDKILAVIKAAVTVENKEVSREELNKLD